MSGRPQRSVLPACLESAPVGINPLCCSCEHAHTAYNAEQLFEFGPMSLRFPLLIDQVKRAGRVLADEYLENAARLPRALQQLLELTNLTREELQRRIELAGERWPGAAPTDENPSARYPAPADPGNLHILASDGSQIHPDRHSGLNYFLINIGTIHIKHGTGLSPEIGSSPHLYYQPKDLHDSQGSPITSALINGRRDVAELSALADLAESCQGQPALALMDNGLILWLVLQDQDRRTADVDRLLQGYMNQLDRLRASETSVAGVVDQPRHASILRLLHLARLPLDHIRPENVKTFEFQGLTDRHVFAALLEPGQRSARFTYKTPVNRNFSVRGHEIQFFYLRSGSRILRVEIPAWVGESDELADRVHAGILAECRSTGGFPYALARAHELAVVSFQDRTALENLLRGELAGRGFQPQPSTKSMTKRWLSGRRRHNL